LVERAPGSGTAADVIRNIADGFGRPMPELTSDEAQPVLPEHWAWVSVGSIADCVLGKMLDKAKHTRGTARPYLRNINVRWGAFDLSDLLEMYFEDDELERYGARPGDVLICEGGEPGRAAVWTDPKPILMQKAIHRVRLGNGVLPEWLVMNLRYDTWTGRLDAYFTGATIKHFTGRALDSYTIRIPPTAEQKRIVAKVDQLMALCDDLEAKQAKKREVGDRLTKAALGALTAAEGPEEFEAAWRRVADHFESLVARSDHVADLRDAIVAAGLSGRLTGASRFGDGPPPGWSRTTLGELTALVTSGSRSWKDYYASSGAVFIRSQDIRSDMLDLGSPAYVSPPRDGEGTRTRVQVGDLLITITGANVGRAARVRKDVGEAYVSQHVALVRLRDASLAEWLHTWLVCGYKGRRQLLGSSYGDKPGLNLSNVRSVIVDLPPPDCRQRILEQIARLMALCDDLEAKLRARDEKAAKLAEALVAQVLG
jgi:type I restriction enzyme S subunit